MWRGPEINSVEDGFYAPVLRSLKLKLFSIFQGLGSDWTSTFPSHLQRFFVNKGPLDPSLVLLPAVTDLSHPDSAEF